MAKLGRWVTVDPGEDTGWTTWSGEKLISAGTSKMWEFADDLWYDLQFGGEDSELRNPAFLRDEAEDPQEPISLVVCEDWRIYPWEAKNLAWDQCRTARLIGAIKFMCRVHEVKMVLQPAAIKERAVSGGAEELFYRPLKENRHQNDAIMHGVFYIQTELYGDLDEVRRQQAALEAQAKGGPPPGGPGAPD